MCDAINKPAGRSERGVSRRKGPELSDDGGVGCGRGGKEDNLTFPSSRLSSSPLPINREGGMGDGVSTRSGAVAIVLLEDGESGWSSCGIRDWIRVCCSRRGAKAGYADEDA